MATQKRRPAAKIAAELDDRRKELKKTQADIANEAYLERSTVYRVLNGYTQTPELYTLIIICKALEFDTGEIIRIVERYGYSITKADQYKDYLEIVRSEEMMEAPISDWVHALDKLVK